MSLLYLAGYDANAVRKAVLSASAAAHAKYPLENLQDGLPHRPFKFAAAGASRYVTADLNFLLNGGFESWPTADLPQYWTKGAGAGSIAKETTIVHAGTASLKLTGVIEAYQDVVVRPGKDYTLEAALYGDGTNAAILRVQDLDTYKWLTSAGTWSASQSDVFSRTLASWVVSSKVFTVEAPTRRRSTTRLRITCVSTAGTTGVFFDSAAVWPEVNFTAVFGHNLGTGASPGLRASTDNFSTSDVLVSSLAVAQPAFYKSFTEAMYRYWRLVLGNAAHEQSWLGEWALGHASTLARTQKWGWAVRLSQPQTRVTVEPTGQLYSVRSAGSPRTDIELAFMAEAEGERDELFRDLLEAAEWGDQPVILVPDEQDELVVHGRVRNVWDYTTEPGVTWDYGLSLEGDAYPVEGF